MTPTHNLNTTEFPKCVKKENCILFNLFTSLRKINRLIISSKHVSHTANIESASEIKKKTRHLEEDNAPSF
jgi:hypothetical protein